MVRPGVFDYESTKAPFLSKARSPRSVPLASYRVAKALPKWFVAHLVPPR